MPIWPQKGAHVADLPRILFVTPAAFNKVTGGGVTFTNLFKGWPQDRLATVHNDPVPTTNEVCTHYYRLGPEEIGLAGWLRPFAGGEAAVVGSMSAEAMPPPPGPRQWVKQWLFGDGAPRRGRLTPKLSDWIEAFAPDALYTILGGNPMMELVEAIAARFSLPMAVHFMDDWPSVIYRGGLVSVFERRRMDRLVRRLVDDAETCLGIGESMCAAFAARYGRPFEPFQNPVDLASRTAPAARPAGSPATVIYAGSVYGDAQAESLAMAAGAVSAMAAAGEGIGLDIHAPDFQLAPFRRRLDLPGVRLLPPLSDDDAFFGRLAAADILLLPVNFDARSVAFIRYSMPTKVPAYLASGTPVLVFGPAGVAQVDYARDAGWGRVVSAPDTESLRRAIGPLLVDMGLRADLTAAAARALPDHDAAVVRPRFWQTLIDTARAA